MHEVDQRPGTQTRLVSSTLLQGDGTISCKQLRFYYTTSLYTWENGVYLTGMITTFIQFCHQFTHSFPFKFASKISKFLLYLMKPIRTIRLAEIFKLLIHLKKLFMIVFYSLECGTRNITLNCLVAFALSTRSGKFCLF